MFLYLWEMRQVKDLIYFCYTILVAIIMITSIRRYIKSNTKKNLNFIATAQKNNCTTVGKLTCLTLHGHKEPDHYQVEYMYVIEGKRYFVTYQMGCKLIVDDQKDAMNADMLLKGIKKALILFYDEKNPAKAMSKLEVFTSADGIHQIKTPKNNIWRDVNKDWTEAIDLVIY